MINKPFSYRKPLSYRTSNPALNSNTFKNVVKKDSLHLDNTMTIRGTVDKTALALCMVVISGYYSFSQGNLTLMVLGGVIGLFLFITLIFKKTWAPFIVPLYSISQGFVVGGISIRSNPSCFASSIALLSGIAPRFPPSLPITCTSKALILSLAFGP